ncbi:hypothetical protein A0H81_11198 [Grifola frondosa]|uniref:Uncharacterized protein n=1 Tax=Grifola frondosa TaxID=5627 RepID=A0A1C7LYA5_GRIFR|nr:hypothetical protein A0H81_11198 [Grifola frondosa]
MRATEIVTYVLGALTLSSSVLKKGLATVFVQNLPVSASEHSVVELFLDLDIREVKLRTGPDGECIGGAPPDSSDNPTVFTESFSIEDTEQDLLITFKDCDNVTSILLSQYI